MEESKAGTRLSSGARGVLRWEDEAGKRQVLYLRAGETAQMGREASNDLFFPDKSVSRRHAVIAWRETAFEIADLGSANGTHVNGERIDRPRMLQDGDELRLCETVSLTFYEIQADSEIGKSGTFIVALDAPQPRLIVSAGLQEGREFPLRAGKLQIGRATRKTEEWDIALPDRAISRPHAEVDRAEERYVLTDLGSANGTLVNGELITEPTVLQDGDVVLLGETILLFRAR